MIKAVVFDLDDTLISERDYINSGFKVISSYIATEYEFNENEIFNLMNELFEETPKNVFNRLLDKLDIEYDIEFIKFLIKMYREHKPNIKFFDDVIPTIESLRAKGIKIGMITDGYKETQRNKLEVLECEHLFDEIIVTDELGRDFWKPHEKSYVMMKERLRCDFKEMIYIGDNENKDFFYPNQVNITSIKIKRFNSFLIYGESGFNNALSKAKYEISKLKVLDKYLEV